MHTLKVDAGLHGKQVRGKSSENRGFSDFSQEKDEWSFFSADLEIPSFPVLYRQLTLPMLSPIALNAAMTTVHSNPLCVPPTDAASSPVCLGQQ